MAIFPLVDADEDLKNTFLILCSCHEMSMSPPPPPTTLLHTARTEQNFIYSMAGSVNRYHAVFPHIFFNSSLFPTSIQLLDGIQREKNNFPSLVPSQHWPSVLHILSKGWKGGRVSRRIFHVRLKQPTHKRIGWRSAGAIWILFRGYVAPL